jgi:hypothetical protein
MLAALYNTGEILLTSQGFPDMPVLSILSGKHLDLCLPPAECSVCLAVPVGSQNISHLWAMCIVMAILWFCYIAYKQTKCVRKKEAAHCMKLNSMTAVALRHCSCHIGCGRKNPKKKKIPWLGKMFKIWILSWDWFTLSFFSTWGSSNRKL